MERRGFAASRWFAALATPCASAAGQQFELYEVAGASSDSRFGDAVAAVGDVDLDGVTDFVVGAPEDRIGGLVAGRASLHSGADGAELRAWIGPTPSRFGFAVAAAGDLDGDGVSDVAVGAPYAVDAATGWGTGAVFVYSSATGGLLQTLVGTSDFEEFGAALAGVGDVDGDGVSDLLVGAPRADFSKVEAGAAWLFSVGTGAVIDRIDGLGKNDRLGSAVAALGDVDGDGVPDLAIGAPQHDASGLANSGVVLVHSGATRVRLFFVPGDHADARLGSVLASGADLDGDGIHDFLIGIPDHSGPLGGEGAVFACSGVDGARIWERSGRFADDRFGGAVALADSDGDGVAELLASAAVDQGVQYPRVEWLASATARTKYAWYVRSPQHGRFGRALALLGDVDGDGVADVLIGAPERDDGSKTWPGLVHVHPGSRFWLSVEPKHPWFGGTVDSSLGEGVPGNLALRCVVAVQGTPVFVPLLPVVALDPQGFFTWSEAVPPGLAGVSVELRAYAVPASGPLVSTNDETITFL
jgi:hypothetical protein